MISNKYSIKDLETLSGVKAHTIRIWEKRFNLLVPERTPTNIRLYSDDDLRKIINISTLLNNHYKISKIAGWDEQQINQAVMEVEENQASAEAYTEQLKTMLLHFDTQSFTEATKEIMARMGVEDAFTKVFFNLLTKLGVYWQAGAIYPAQEHFATYVFRKQLIAETVKAENSKRNGKTILFFLHENELHEMGLLFYTYLATKHGYNVIYLGAQVPFSDLEKMESAFTIDMVFTHFVNPTSSEMLEDYLTRLKSLFKRQTIFISGLQIKKSKITPPGIKIISGYHDFVTSIQPNA